MWCEEINEKYRELAKDSPWWFQPKGFSASDTSMGVAYGDDYTINHDHKSYSQRVPPPARTLRQADLTLQLLAAFYKNPHDFSTGADCDWAFPGYHPMWKPAVRAWMLGNLAAPGPSFFRMREYDGTLTNTLPSQLVGVFQSVAIRILSNPDGPGHAMTQIGESVVSALCDVILVSDAVDQVVWPLLWIWAAGGTTGKVLLRTRSHALQAISAIARRKPQYVGSSTIALIERLAQSVDGITPPKSYAEEQERQLFAYTANSAAGDVAASLAQQALAVPPGLTNPNTFLPPGTRPLSFWNSLPRWAPMVGGAGLVSVILGAVLLWRGTTPSRRSLPA